MSRVSPWRSFMRQSCTVAPLSTEDSRGAPTYGAAVTYRCRLVGKKREIVNSAGRIMISGQTVYLASGDLVLEDAKVTLSTGDVGSTEETAMSPPIFGVGTYPDETGLNVYTALFLK